MITPSPDYTALPAVPSRGDPPPVFVPDAAAFTQALPGFGTEMAAIGVAAQANGEAAEAAAASAEADADAADAAADAALGASDLMRRSPANLVVSAGAKAVTGLQNPTPADFVDGEEYLLSLAGDAETLMWGVASACNMVGGTMTVTVAAGDFAGAGSHTDWIVRPRAGAGMQPATAAEVRAGLSSVKGISAKVLMDAAAFAVLAYGATVNWDFDAGFNRYLTLAGNPTMAAPTHLHDGLGCTLAIAQGAGGNTITWNAIFDWGADGAPTLSTGAGKVDFAFGVYNPTTGKIHMTFRRAA